MDLSSGCPHDGSELVLESCGHRARGIPLRSQSLRLACGVVACGAMMSLLFELPHPAKRRPGLFRVDQSLCFLNPRLLNSYIGFGVWEFDGLFLEISIIVSLRV